MLLAVDPAHQRRGLGRRLLREVVGGLDRGASWLVTTDADTPAMQLYRDEGWHRIGSGPDAPDGRPAAVLLRERHDPGRR